MQIETMGKTLIAALAFSALGILLFAIAFFIIVKVTPFSLRKEIEEDQNTSLAIIIASVILVIAICALIYELLCGTLASWLLGDAVLQFSLVLGTYLSAMGAGAWISKR